MYDVVIGIEIHVELKSKMKAFSSSLNKFVLEPNKNISFYDLAYPGCKPKLNKEVVEMALKASLQFNCFINKKMYFERKCYFYPDLPKGYQITQNETPIGYNGYLKIDEERKIAIERIHIEEDTAKSIHKDDGTYLDFNRAGVPLIEIVTKPVIKSAEEAMLYVTKVQETLLYLGISDVKIEEGSMRCDVNISLKEKDSEVLGQKVEIKNIGSISNIGESINYEIKRQTEILNKGAKVYNETRRYDDKIKETILLRRKDELTDYRFHPEVNLPLVILSDDYIEKVRSDLPIMPSALRDKYIKLGLNNNNIKTIISNYSLCCFFETVILKTDPLLAANLLTSEVLTYLNKEKREIKDIKLTSANFIQLIDALTEGVISSKQVKDVILILMHDGGDVFKIIDELGLKQISDDKFIFDIIDKVISNNEQSVLDYKSGQTRAFKFLMGQIMKETKGQINPEKTKELLEKRLS